MLKSEIDDGLNSTVRMILRLFKKKLFALDDQNIDGSYNWNKANAYN